MGGGSVHISFVDLYHGYKYQQVKNPDSDNS